MIGIVILIMLFAVCLGMLALCKRIEKLEQ